MAKDLTDCSTVDFIVPVIQVSYGQVLVDRQRHIAIVTKCGKNSAHLVQVRPGGLKIAKHTAENIIANWFDTDYPFGLAVNRLLALGKQRGMTVSAHQALELLLKNGREPRQYQLF